LVKTIQKLDENKSVNSLLPEEEITLCISELKKLARHPWKFFLQKRHKIFLNEELEESFSLQKGKLVRTSLEMNEAKSNLPGPFNDAMQIEVAEKVNERKSQMKEWRIEPFTLTIPTIEFSWEKWKVKLVGEIKFVSNQGMISLNEDNIGGTLKIWPEALAASVVLNAPQIWMVRSGKTKPLNSAYDQLKTFIEYYFHCSLAPSPLLPEWADAMLRKGDFSMDGTEDPVAQWVFARARIPAAENWEPILKKTFQSLIDLYPVRGSVCKSSIASP